MISDKRSVQQIIAFLKQFEIEDVVISPGSRNGPLTYSFSQSEHFNCYSIVDERCAGFFALGMAQQHKSPVVLCCTSGTALLNYSPAIAEAYYQRIPLLVISADRPQEFLNHGIGQTIDQKEVFRNFANHSVHLSGESLTDEQFNINNDLISNALNKLHEPHPGPVHINVPLQEPLYNYITESSIATLKPHKKESHIPHLSHVQTSIDEANRILILTGLLDKNSMLQEGLSELAKKAHVLVMTETSSNLIDHSFITTTDRMIFNFDDADIDQFKPNVLITIGTNIVSKKIKQILRHNPPEYHWHIDESGKEIDTYGCLTETVKIDPLNFLSKIEFGDNISEYSRYHLKLNDDLKKIHKSFMSICDYSDLKVIEQIIENIPIGSLFQMGNSSVVRYIQLFDQREDLIYYANRGTSGIDGVTSTAIGAAHASSKPTTVVTGDIAFLYDSNALWNDYIPDQFKIIVINNGGGGIFRIIPGPNSTGVMDRYFETSHNLNARHLAEMHGLEYLEAHNLQSLETGLEDLYDSPQPKILEIFTPREKNDKILKSYFECLKQVSKPELTGEKLRPMKI